MRFIAILTDTIVSAPFICTYLIIWAIISETGRTFVKIWRLYRADTIIIIQSDLDYPNFGAMICSIQKELTSKEDKLSRLWKLADPHLYIFADNAIFVAYRTGGCLIAIWGKIIPVQEFGGQEGRGLYFMRMLYRKATCEKIMWICHKRPLDKFMRFLFMHSSTLCMVMYSAIKIYAV